jgi:hypothetical protein
VTPILVSISEQLFQKTHSILLQWAPVGLKPIRYRKQFVFFAAISGDYRTIKLHEVPDVRSHPHDE